MYVVLYPFDCILKILLNQDALEYGYIIEFYGQFLDTQGLVFTYNATDDVYDVTGFNLADTSMANGSINLFIPATFDNGTNGRGKNC